MIRHHVSIVDSHTGGEPTRVVTAGGPELGGGPLAERARRLATEHERWYKLVIDEPRGSSIHVGALLLPPTRDDCIAGVIYFDNVTVLGMCGHGTIGVVATLAHLGRMTPGTAKLETPAGVVDVTLHADGRVTLGNVPSFRKAKNVAFDVEGRGEVRGDIAYGGNWFFITRSVSGPFHRERADELTQITRSIRIAIDRLHPEVEHIVLLGPPVEPRNHARNFVLCPGFAWDRSPCGTGTSAIVACLAANGDLKPGDVWRQESTSGSVFEATFTPNADGTITPAITGTASITGEGVLFLQDDDGLGN